nr:uncharacterized mitochondrial protein AtMg00810-like [Nicotiana tomentosiformis]
MQHLSQFLQAPRLPHMTVALHMLKYLKGTIDVVLFYSNSPDCTLTAYSDSDWAACPDTRKFISDFCLFLGDCLVASKYKKQPVVSLSSVEVEYMALSKVVAELTWLTIAKNPVFHERTKHIETSSLSCLLGASPFFPVQVEGVLPLQLEGRYWAI